MSSWSKLYANLARVCFVGEADKKLAAEKCVGLRESGDRKELY